MRVAVSGLVTPYSGIGVMQRKLYPRLESLGLDLIELPSRQPGSGRLARIGALAGSTFVSLPKDVDHFLSVVTPFPVTLKIPTTTFVYDLRWLRGRSSLSRAYRARDLRRAIRGSEELVAISERTAGDLIAFDPGAAAVVAHLGPGQFDSTEFRASSSRDVMLVGAAKHKRNEMAAELIAAMPDGWVGSVFGVNVSPETVSILEDALGPSRCHWHANITTAQMNDIYRKCGISFQLSVEEGFGLPYIEALAAGQVVVAIDQPLTREVLGSAAILLQEQSVVEMVDQLVNAALPDEAARKTVAAKYSWDDFSTNIYQMICDSGKGGTNVA